MVIPYIIRYLALTAIASLIRNIIPKIAEHTVKIAAVQYAIPQKVAAAPVG